MKTYKYNENNKVFLSIELIFIIHFIHFNPKIRRKIILDNL